MNNIPESILQTVADEAFNQPIEARLSTRAYHLPDWKNQECARRAVIQHALSNPDLAPFLAGGIGEYTDAEINQAMQEAIAHVGDYETPSMKWFRAFLAALPRRESPSLAEAIARAEKAEAELAALKSAQLGILRPLSEMPETVPEGCVKVSGWFSATEKQWTLAGNRLIADTHFAILRLPAVEARQERPVGFNSALETWGAAEATPTTEVVVPVRPYNEQAKAEDAASDAQLAEELAAEPEPAAQVPLGPEDCPPGSAFRFAEKHWYNALYVSCEVVCLISGDSVTWKDWNKLQDDGWQINTSLPDTGRWDATAWRDRSKPAK